MVPNREPVRQASEKYFRQGGRRDDLHEIRRICSSFTSEKS